MTTTQGEHAQTESPRPIQRFNNIAGLMNPESRGLYVRYEDHAAQVAALTAATAQPAAPQGVAYAELPEPDSYLFQHDETGLTQFVDAQQVEWGFQQNNPRLRRIGGAYTADQMRDFADRAHALRASHGQAPAAENELWRKRLLNEDIAWLEMFAPNTAVRSHIIDVLRGAMDWQAPASRITVEQVEDAIGLQSTAWDTIGAEKIVEAVLRLANGQAPAGATREPTAFIHWPIDGPPRLVWYSQKALNDAILKTYEGHQPDVKLYTAQAAPAAADFTTLGAALRAIQQAIDLIGEPADDRMRTVKRVLRGAVIVAEDSGELSAPAAGAVAGPTREQIRDVFLANGFTVKEGQTDLKPYVYAAAEALLALAAAPTPAAPADSTDMMTPREAALIVAIQGECNHAARNDMRLNYSMDKARSNVIAVPESMIDAAIEGWKHEHGVRELGPRDELAAQADSQPAPVQDGEY